MGKMVVAFAPFPFALQRSGRSLSLWRSLRDAQAATIASQILNRLFGLAFRKRKAWGPSLWIVQTDVRSP